MKVAIEKNIPIPPARRARNPFPSVDWANMEVGDSVLIQLSDEKAHFQARGEIYTLSRLMNRRHTIRVQEGNAFRVWRVE